MLTFSPPTTSYPNQTGDWLLDMVSTPKGLTVYSLDGGVTFQTGGEFPYLGNLASTDPITSQHTGPSANAAEGVTYFLGGHIYTITSAQATALINSGYGAYITFPADTYWDTYSDTYNGATRPSTG